MKGGGIERREVGKGIDSVGCEESAGGGRRWSKMECTV